MLHTCDPKVEEGRLGVLERLGVTTHLVDYFLHDRLRKAYNIFTMGQNVDATSAAAGTTVKCLQLPQHVCIP
jgi:hypothetical protein